MTPQQTIYAGSQLTIRYEPPWYPHPVEPTCPTSTCTVEAAVEFHPGNEVINGVLIEETHDHFGSKDRLPGPVAWRHLDTFVVNVPSNATSMQIRFRKTNADGQPSQDHDVSEASFSFAISRDGFDS